jgi:hypothetical protein
MARDDQVDLIEQNFRNRFMQRAVTPDSVNIFDQTRVDIGSGIFRPEFIPRRMINDMSLPAT